MNKEEYIVLIDDDYATNVYHEIIIQETGLIDNYKFFDCPIQALEILENTSTIPSLIFLDINMPKMDGWEFLEAYSKMNAAFKTTKIVMLSTSLSSFDKKKAEENPLVTDYMQKPLTDEKLLKYLSYSPT